MRAWVFGAVLAAVAAGGVYVAVIGTAARSHCGECLKGKMIGGILRDDVELETERDQVTEVVDLTAALAPPKAEPGGLPFVSFDEPPLAKPKEPRSDPAVQQTTFIAPIVDDGLTGIEVAPPPRSKRAEGGPTPLYGPDDPF